MKILYIAHRIPFPPNKGDKIRSFNQIKYLSENNEIDLVCIADEKEDIQYRGSLENYCENVFVFPLDKKAARIKGLLSLLKLKPISSGYFYIEKLKNIVSELIKKREYDAVFCFCSPMAEYVFREKNLTKEKLVMDFCDLDSDKWDQYSKSSPFPFNLVYKTEAKLLFEYEKKINKVFNHSFFVSGFEAELFKRKNLCAENITPIPNGVDFKYFSKNGNGKTPGKKVVFTGVMDYYANIEGVLWFAEKIFPQLMKKHDDLEFYVVGKNPVKEIKDLEKNRRIRVTGFVDDIRPYYEMADICVVPLKIARGIQNKVLEAMSMERAVVSTSKALEGIDAVPGKDVFKADTEDEFIKKIDELLMDGDLAEKTGKRARNLIKEKYSWENGLKNLEALLL